MHLEDSGRLREKGGKVNSVKPLECHAFGGQCTDERERWEGALWESLLKDMHLKDSGRMRESWEGA
jgi:hypothetical protein